MADYSFIYLSIYFVCARSVGGQDGVASCLGWEETGGASGPYSSPNVARCDCSCRGDISIPTGRLGLSIVGNDLMMMIPKFWDFLGGLGFKRIVEFCLHKLL